MSSSLNKVSLIGYLGRDPEIKCTNDGLRICTLSVATSESWLDKQSNTRKERTEWHRVIVFNNKLADIIEKYLHKGSRIYLEGQLQTRKWTTSDGITHYSTEIILTQYKGELNILDIKKDPISSADLSINSVNSSSNIDYQNPAAILNSIEPDMEADLPF